ncbi:protein MKS1 [Melia azedarach]|uniref:Protein MKS1 n=1 Tax=Melia azedarach TaxID=155640 RepID=A0ACC1XWG8_MELAZ|nr:protein MKS1 [Melia azedarach]
MDSTNFSTGGKRPSSTKAQLQIQGPRPAPLCINKDSHKIKKPPRPPPSEPSQNHNHQRQQPVVIYAVSPKVINVTVADFMTTVQRLTGSSSESFSASGDVSPAARLASVEKAMSPKERSSPTATTVRDHRAEEEETTQLGRIPGILSPAELPPVIQEMYFSPRTAAATATSTATDPFGFSGLYGNGGLFASSPSGLFSNLVGSPVFSPDFFSEIWNF